MCSTTRRQWVPGKLTPPSRKLRLRLACHPTSVPAGLFRSGRADSGLVGDPIRSASRRKLFAWLMDSDLEADERAARCVRTMKDVVSDLPEPAQLGAVLEMLEVLGRRCSAALGTVPLWLTRVVEKVGSYRVDASETEAGMASEIEEHVQ